MDRIFSTMGEADRHPSAVSLAYFHRFVEIHGGRDAFQDLTTEDVCDRFILPFTESTKLSLVDHVSQEPDGQQFVQPTQWFVSHAWSYHFLDVLDALDNFVDENNLDQRVAFWFCAFNNNQHDIKGQIRSFEFWLGGFQGALTSSRQIVMVLSPWTNPVTLTRTWCVYEVYMSIVLNARFEIAMGKTQKTEFLQDMKAGDDQIEIILQALATINTQESTTTIASDRDHIFKLISDQVGFAKLDQMVLHVLLDWMVRTVKHQTESSTDPEERFRWFSSLGAVLTMADKQVEADMAYKTAADIFRQSLPRSFWYGWRICHIEAFSKARLMQPRDVWEPMFNESLPMLQELLGPDHRITLRAIKEVGEAYCQFGDFTGGMPLLEGCLASQERVFGRDNVETLRTMNLIGMYKSRQNQLIDATEWLQRAYDLHCKIYGPLHSETNICRSTLAVCYARQGKFHQAEPLLQESYDYHWRALGPEHCATLYNLSAILRSNGDYDKAEANLEFCIDNFRKAGDTSWVLHCERALGLVCLSRGDLKQAMAFLEPASKAYVAMLGPKHMWSRGILYDRYLVQREMLGGFDSLEMISSLEDELKQAEIFHETSITVVCHSCFTPIQGDMGMCSECPRHSIRCCRQCVDGAKYACGHTKSSWIFIKPPACCLQEERLGILAHHEESNEHASYAKEYRDYCDQFKVLEHDVVDKMKPSDRQVKSNRRGSLFLQSEPLE
ncbi:hypothetical protein Ae201684P_022374 [Aphanomyces euteiches]|nr:hypothetical protein Ae201684P_022374 [Aphanomyces euteiches]